MGSSLKKCHVTPSPLRRVAQLIPPRRKLSLIPLGCLTSGILPGQRSTLSGCLTAAILSGRHPTLSGCITVGIISDRRSTFSDISHPTSAAGWERRTIQLPRADMSGSFGKAYSDNIHGQRFRFLG